MIAYRTDSFRVEDAEKLTFTEAQALINSLVARRKKKLCTYRQAKWLKKFGHPVTTTFVEAGLILDLKFGKGKKQGGAKAQ